MESSTSRPVIKKIKKRVSTRRPIHIVDPRAEEFRLLNLRRRAAPALNPPPPKPKPQVIGFPEMQVPRRYQIWRKELYSSFVEKQMRKAEQQYKPSYFANVEDHDLDFDKSKIEYRTLDEFWKLSEMERVETNDYQRDMIRYEHDKETTDGFDVGYYPHRDAAGICSSGFIFRHYKPPKLIPSKESFNALVHLSNLAVYVYNMYQLNPTHYDNVEVLKAMTYGPFCTKFNITFQTSFPTSPTIFQTRVYCHSEPPFVNCSDFEIVLVRKFKGGEVVSEEESDYVGDESHPGFPKSMYSLSDFDEQHPQPDKTVPVLSENKLPLHLSQLALHWYSIDEDYDQDDESYDSVKVLGILNALKTLDDEHGTTYYVVFEASLPDESGNPQIFETKFFVSPLVPTTKIQMKYVRVKPN